MLLPPIDHLLSKVSLQKVRLPSFHTLQQDIDGHGRVRSTPINSPSSLPRPMPQTVLTAPPYASIISQPRAQTPASQPMLMGSINAGTVAGAGTPSTLPQSPSPPSPPRPPRPPPPSPPKKTRKTRNYPPRRRKTIAELSILQAEFEMCPTPARAKQLELAERLKMPVSAVTVWFQNKRQNRRQKQQSEKRVFEVMD